MLVTVLGSGKSFGPVDAFKMRNFMYTLRTKTRNVRLWAVDSDKFITHIKSYGRMPAFKLWQKERDSEMINQLARNMYNIVRGSNFDGSND